MLCLTTVMPVGTAATLPRRGWIARETPLLAWLTTPSVVVSPGGGSLYVIASVRGDTRVPKLFVRARSAASGELLWTVRYRGRDVLAHRSGWATIDASRTVYVLAEFRRRSGQRGAIVIAFDGSDGAVRWETQVGGANGVRAGGLTLSPDGARLYVGLTSGQKPEHVGITAIDASHGDVTWRGRYEGPDGRPDLMEENQDSIVATDDAVIVAVTGRHDRRRTSLGRATTVAFDASNGGVRWDGVSGRAGFAAQYSEHGLALTPDHRTVITGGWSRNRSAAVAFDVASGTRVWRRVFSGRRSGSLQSAAVTPDGETVLLAGNAAPTRLVVTALATRSGRVSWWREAPSWKGYPWILDAVLAPDGSALYVPVIRCGPEADIEILGCYLEHALFGYRTSSGRRSLIGRVATRFGLHEIPEDVAVSPRGRRVYVTGYTGVLSRPRWYTTTAMFRVPSPGSSSGNGAGPG
jgi:outer membrane protein assembly factor BamB